MTSTSSPKAELGELIRGLGALCERPGPSSARLADALGLSPPSGADHTELFVQQLPPYASIYLDLKGKIGGEAQDRVAGFWRALQMTPPREPDHLASLLGLWAALNEMTDAEQQPERRRLWDHAQGTLVWEHLAPWLVPYLSRVIEVSESFRDWAGLVEAVIDDALSHGESADLPYHLTIPHKELESPDDLVPYLLTPMRSGIVLTRADLGAAATSLGLGMRIGERAFSLKSLMEQAPEPMLQWVATEADRQASIYSSSEMTSAITAVWAERAATTRSVLDVLAKRAISGR